MAGVKSAKELLDIYFLENRARVLEIAALLDRIDRAAGAQEARDDCRYKALRKAIETLHEREGDRAKKILLSFSDQTTEPIESAVGLKASGVWEGAFREGN